MATIDPRRLQTSYDVEQAAKRAALSGMADISIDTQYSIVGGGDLSLDRTLTLVGDEENPGQGQSYRTDADGNRGYHDAILPVDGFSIERADIDIENPRLQLKGDEHSPGANKVYGTDSAGVRGWQDAGDGGGYPPQLGYAGV